MMTFEQFQATGRDVADLGEVIEGCDLDGRPGRVYLDAAYIEKMDGARWFLLICNMDWISVDLEKLEKELYDFCVSEGFC